MRIVTNHLGNPALKLPPGSSLADRKFYVKEIDACVDWISTTFSELDLAVCQDGTISSRVIDKDGNNLFYLMPMWSLKSLLCKLYRERNVGNLKPSHVSKVVADFLPRLVKSCQELDLSTLKPGQVIVASDETSHLDINTM